MAEVYRRTLDELVTRYMFEPALRDLYIEGDQDRGVFDCFFLFKGVSQVKAYAISNIEIPEEFLRHHGLSGNRGRVCALALHLEHNLPPNCVAALGLVDSDFAPIFGDLPRTRLLVATDYACLECYAIAGASFTKFCRLYLRRDIDGDLAAQLFGVLKEI